MLESNGNNKQSMQSGSAQNDDTKHQDASNITISNVSNVHGLGENINIPETIDENDVTAELLHPDSPLETITTNIENNSTPNNKTKQRKKEQRLGDSDTDSFFNDRENYEKWIVERLSDDDLGSSDDGRASVAYSYTQEAYSRQTSRRGSLTQGISAIAKLLEKKSWKKLVVDHKAQWRQNVDKFILCYVTYDVVADPIEVS